MPNEPTPAQAAVLDLLGYGADAELTAAQRFKLEITTALKTMFDGQAEQLKGGKAVDPNRLITVIEALAKLLPEPEPPQQQEEKCEGAHDALARLIGLPSDWRTHDYEADEAAEAAELERLKAEVEALRAENELLKASQPVRAPQTEVLPPASTKALPAPEPQQNAVARANERTPQPPRHWLKSGQPPEPWSEFISADSPGHRRWQPT
jgi:hypothetical protein